MKPLWLAALVCFCLLVAGGCAPAETFTAPSPTVEPPTAAPPTAASDLVAPVKAWAEGMNKGDVDAALAPFTDDAFWTGWIHKADGRSSMRSVFDFMAGIGTKLGAPECQPGVDRVACTLSVADGCMAAYGLSEGFDGTVEFVYGPDGKVKQGRLDFSPDPRWQDYEKFWTSKDGWVLVNHPEGWVSMETGGREGGATWLELCQEYAESLK